jgi:hypothetical protein
MSDAKIERIKPLPEIPEPDRGISIERAKALIDLLKHVATLSTATLLLTATMADRLFAGAVDRSLLIVPLVSSGIALAAALVAHMRALELVDRRSLRKGTVDGLALWGSIAIVLFLVSLAVIGFVAVKNFPT